MAELRLVAISQQTGREEYGKQFMHVIENHSTRNHPCGTISIGSTMREDFQIAEAVFYMSKLVDAGRCGDSRGNLQPIVDKLKDMVNSIDPSLINERMYENWCKADRKELDEYREYLEKEKDEQGYIPSLRRFAFVNH